MPKKLKYVLVDDEAKSIIRPFITSLKKADGHVTAEHLQPLPFEDMIDEIKSRDLSAIILDLRLNILKPEGDNKKARYTAQGLAQELRALMAQKKMSAMPIVLWSADDNLKNYFDIDDTAQDLFDLIYRKGEVKAPQAAHELRELSLGYREISDAIKKHRTAPDILYESLAISSDDDFIDSRIPDAIEKSKSNLSVHEVARFICTNLIGISGPYLLSGPLIDENVLAARFGIDIKKSKDWPKLRDKLFAQFGYKGVFSKEWPRWWAPLAERWWSKSMKEQPLVSLTAEDRVSLLKKKLRLTGLQPAKALKHANSTKFWTVCQATLMPIDPGDALRASEPERLPWQDVSYLSVNSLLQRIAKQKGFRVHPLDIERFKLIRESLSR